MQQHMHRITLSTRPGSRSIAHQGSCQLLHVPQRTRYCSRSVLLVKEDPEVHRRSSVPAPVSQPVVVPDDRCRCRVEKRRSRLERSRCHCCIRMSWRMFACSSTIDETHIVILHAASLPRIPLDTLSDKVVCCNVLALHVAMNTSLLQLSELLLCRRLAHATSSHR